MAVSRITEKIIPILFVLFCTFCVQSASPITPAPPAENSTNYHLNEVIIGADTLDRFTSNQMVLGSFYSTKNATMERGFYTFSVLLNTFNTLSILENNNLSSDTLSIYKILINGLLDDACLWFKTYNDEIDCEDKSSLITLLLSFGLKPHLSNMECFLRATLGNFRGDQTSDGWITRIFATTPFQDENLKCQLCCDLNLGTQCSCPCPARM